jgi:hypothetical protein
MSELVSAHPPKPHPAPSAVASDHSFVSWRGRRPQPGDQRQNSLEHLTRHRDFGYLEGLSARGLQLRADLDKLSCRLVSRCGLHTRAVTAS